MITHEFLFVFRKQFAALMLLFIGHSLWAYSSVVTSSANDGSGTLREAIAVAEDGDTITLAVPSGRIALTNELEILSGRFGDDGLVVKGNGASLDGQNLCRLLYVGDKNRIVLNDVNFENGHGPDLGQGGAIYNQGDLYVSNSVFRNNGIYKGYTKWNGEEFDVVSGSGGAIYNSGRVEVCNIRFACNSSRNTGAVLFNAAGSVVLRNVDIVSNRVVDVYSNHGYSLIHCKGGNLQMDNVCCHDMIRGSYSGGCLVGATGMESIFMDDCRFIDNCITNDGRYSQMVLGLDGRDLRLTNVAITNNVLVCDDKYNGLDACVIKCSAQSAILSNVVFSCNNGGMDISSVSNGTVRICDSSFTNNRGGETALKLSGLNICVDQCDFERNVTSGGGIGCSLYSGGSTTCCSNLIIKNSRFVSNRAYGISGPNMTYGSGAISTYSIKDSVVSNCLFVSNSCDEGDSGAIGYFPFVVDCVFSNNVSCSGGAAEGGRFQRCSFVGNCATNGIGGAVRKKYGTAYTSRFEYCNFLNNRASNSGGAIAGCAISLDHCSLVSNSAPVCGGAVYSYSTRRFLVSSDPLADNARGWYHNVVANCSFLGNSADRGGAISGGNVYWYNPGTMIYNCTFFKNQAIGGGSAVCGYSNYHSGLNYFVANSTFVGNEGGSLMYGTGAMIGNVTAENGEYDYFYYVVNESRLSSDVMPTAWFSALCGKFGGVYRLNPMGIFALDVERDVECLPAGKPKMQIESRQGVDRIYFRPNSAGEVPGRGAFVWHDERWNNIAYSMSKDSTKYALLGIASNATICVDRDCLGQEIEYPACPGAVYCPAPKAVMHTVSFDTCGGPSVEPMTVANGMEVGTLPLVDREDYWLYGWYADRSFGDKVGQNTQIDRDRTFYSRWIPDVQPDGGPYPQIVDGIEWTYFVSGGKSSIKTSSNKSVIGRDISGSIRVPSALGGHPVCEVGEYAFLKCDRLTEVILPETVSNIASYAFSMCSGLNTIEIPSHVATLGAYAFSSCYGLGTVIFRGPLPEGVEASSILDHATEVWYPREYAEEYEAVVPSEIFAGFTDDFVGELCIATRWFPDAIEMVDYEVRLGCSGGVEPYTWSLSEFGYRAGPEESAFSEFGEARRWREDDGAWKYALPFVFNYHGRAYDSLVVHDDAYLTFGTDDSVCIDMGFGDLFSENSEQDVFIEQGEDHVAFRWSRVRYSNRAEVVNCAITLYANGAVRCSYGDCFNTVRTCSLCDPVSGFADSVYEQEGDGDVVFVPNYLPPGLSLSEDGVISGVPELAGRYEFEVTVQDDDGETCTKLLAVDVTANPNRRPVAESWNPCESDDVRIRGGASRSFSVQVTDLDDDALTYRWYMDGDEIEGADDAACMLATDSSMRGWHTLSCEVSDGLWTIVAHEWRIGVSGEMSVSADDGEDALQKALDQAVSGDVIYVGPGVYSPIEDWSHDSIRIVATEGCENTVIDGGGVSPCVQVNDYGSTNCMIRIEGFTIENGYAYYGGGASGAWLIGCVVRNNVAEHGGGGLRCGRADSCLFVGNSANYGGGANSAGLYNCTVVGNAAAQFGGGADDCLTCNSIVWGNESQNDDSNVDDPKFVDPDNGDYTLLEGSPCIGMGDNVLVSTAHDLLGNPRIQGGEVDLGAYESAYALPTPDDASDMWTSPRTYGIVLDWSAVAYAKWYEVYRVDDALDDDAAELIATVSRTGYEDVSAESGKDYRYWVVPCNETGKGEMSEYGIDCVLPPLQIANSTLPDADDGVDYVQTLLATGGDENYTWNVPSYVAKVEKTSSYAEVGEPMGWTDDDGDWLFALPFDFPAYGCRTNLVDVSDNGYISIPVDNGWATVYAAYDMDLYADPGDIYVQETADAVTFRWERVVYDTTDTVNVSVTLYSNGRIRLACDSNAMAVDRGIEYDDCEFWYDVAGDVFLTPNTLPTGLALDCDGALSGVPEGDGTYRFVARVEDGNGEWISREITMRVNGENADPIPDLGDSPSSMDVYEALSGSADWKLQDNITDGEDYNAYRAWAVAVMKSDGSGTAGARTVRNAPNAWLSYALASQILIPTAPNGGDLKVDKFEPTSADGSFDFTVSIEDIAVGTGATKENLKKVFGLEGGASLEDMSADKVNISFGTPENGKVKFTAGPKDTTQSTFFMKVKMTP